MYPSSHEPGLSRPIRFTTRLGKHEPMALESRMDFDSIGEIIATRRLHYFDEANHQRTVSVLVGKPQQLPDSSDYLCPFQVIGIGTQQTHSARPRFHTSSAISFHPDSCKSEPPQRSARAQDSLGWRSQGRIGISLSQTIARESLSYQRNVRRGFYGRARWAAANAGNHRGHLIKVEGLTDYSNY